MKTSTKLLALLLSTFALAGCASTGKKCKSEGQSPVPASTPVVAAQPVAAPVAAPATETAAEVVPAATRKYVSK